MQASTKVLESNVKYLKKKVERAQKLLDDEAAYKLYEAYQSTSTVVDDSKVDTEVSQHKDLLQHVHHFATLLLTDEKKNEFSTKYDDYVSKLTKLVREKKTVV